MGKSWQWAAVAVCCVVQIYAHQSHAFSRPQKREIAYARVHPREWLMSVVKRNFRPTVSEVVTVFKNCPACVTVLRDYDSTSLFDRGPRGAPNGPDYAEILANVGPGTIAFFEAFYPNGLYAPLGRDTFLVGDLLEAFYIGQGLESPVVRLAASTPTITAMATHTAKLKFLAANRFDLERIQREEKPYVIIDRTSFHERSQSASLLRAAFLHVTDDAERRALGQLVNVVSTSEGIIFEGSPPARRPAEFAELKRSFSNWKEYTPQIPPALRGPKGIASLTDIDRLNWHSGFGERLFQRPDGSLAGEPTTPEPLQARLEVIQFFWELYHFVRTPVFVAAVEEKAREFGIEARLRARFEHSRDICAEALVL